VPGTKAVGCRVQHSWEVVQAGGLSVSANGSQSSAHILLSRTRYELKLGSTHMADDADRAQLLMSK
jgi:hypothetical protein